MLNFILNILTQKKYDYKFCKRLNKLFYPYILSKIYFQKLNKKLKLNNPQKFTEKIQWMKLYDNLELKTLLTDKLKAKDWVKKNISFIKIPKVYQEFKNFDEFEISKCPNYFVIKMNSGCKMNHLVRDASLFKDKKIYDKVKQYFNKLIKIDYEFISGFEMQYKGIDKKIFIEEWLNYPFFIHDYKIHCFNGEPKFIEFMNKDIKKNVTVMLFYDTKWNRVENYWGKIGEENDVEKPENLEKMLDAAKIIARYFKYVRVDLYNLDGEIYFAEATFSPFSGFIIFNNPEWDFLLGNMLKL